ncbi:MAG: hypothetical protein QOD75_3624 [Blastocatellia bacterium]|nr:hypothetical protein [Blastocatellia bacterium]
MAFPSQIKSLWTKARPSALGRQEEALRQPRSRRIIAAICVAIFALAVGVRLLQWQDNRPILPRVFAGMVEHHKANARLLLHGDVSGFIKGPAPPGDANILTYPPGYPIIMAAVLSVFGDSEAGMRFFQIVCDAATAVVLFFLALEFLPVKGAVIAGALAALSPQLAYYSLILIPDSLVTLPILLALYFLVRGLKRNSLRAVMVAGVCIGVSCWLRSNALLLAPFLAVFLLLIMDRSRRWRYTGVLVGATFLVIAPITIRNVIVFHHFIPLSLGTGQMLNVGISDYDKERRFGLPASDIETVTGEAATYGRPDYAQSLFGGNGIERDGRRTSRAEGVMRSHPFWFGGVVLRRAFSMLRLERVPVITIEPAVTHSLIIAAGVNPVWSVQPSDFIARSTSGPRIAPATNGNAVRLQGHEIDSSGATYLSTFEVETNTDYLVRFPFKIEEGSVTVSVISPSQKERYATTPVLHVLETLPAAGQQTVLIQVPFVSRENGTAHLLVENEKRRPGPLVAEVGKMELFRLGPASLVWMRYPRILMHLMQRLFVTAWMVPLAFIGAVLLWRSNGIRWRPALLHPKGGGHGGPPLQILLLAIPLYYLSAQSFLHTEYRYVMAIQPSLFVFIAATLNGLANSLVRILSRNPYNS